MIFIIQHNLLNIDKLLEVQLAVERYPHEFVGVIPFDHEITSDKPIIGTEYIPYGSTLFTALTHELGWKGNYFSHDTFNYKAFLENRDDMLNSNVMKIEDAIAFLETVPESSEWFTRPSLDLKQYVGMVENAKDLLAWFKDAVGFEGSGSYKIELGTEIVLCEPRAIQAEYRWFIVGGKVVSGSMYRYRGNLYKQRCTEPDIIAEAQRFADKWLPHDNCCMDLALVDGEVKVVEFNCINSSGFYDNDVSAIFKAIWEYHQ